MKIPGVVVSVLVVGAVTAVGGEAQSRSRSHQAAVADLAQDGEVDDADLFIFQGCPQDDPVGRAVFEAVREFELGGYETTGLALVLAWGGAYPDCDYAPLNAWMVRTFEQLYARGEQGPAMRFARNLEPEIHAELQEALLRAAEDEALLEEPRTAMADAAIFKGPAERQVPEAIAAFRRNLPRQWKASTTYRLTRDFGPVFFEALASAAPSFSDEQIARVAGAIRSEILDGRADPNVPGMDRLRANLRARPELPPWVQIPTTRRRGPGRT